MNKINDLLRLCSLDDRNRCDVRWLPAEGDAETETTHMPEGRQTAARSYREQYQKYKRMTEAALNSEPIPLGHRQTIRRYLSLVFAALIALLLVLSLWS